MLECLPRHHMLTRETFLMSIDIRFFNYSLPVLKTAKNVIQTDSSILVLKHKTNKTINLWNRQHGRNILIACNFITQCSKIQLGRYENIVVWLNFKLHTDKAVQIIIPQSSQLVVILDSLYRCLKIKFINVI